MACQRKAMERGAFVMHYSHKYTCSTSSEGHECLSVAYRKGRIRRRGCEPGKTILSHQGEYLLESASLDLFKPWRQPYGRIDTMSEPTPVPSGSLRFSTITFRVSLVSFTPIYCVLIAIYG